MKHYIIWHDNGDKTRNADTCGYSEEISDRTLDEICESYKAHGCTIFSVSIINDPT